MSLEKESPQEREVSALINEAEALYAREATHADFLKAFDRSELVRLLALVSNGQYSWDDEVFDALAIGYNHFEDAQPPVPESQEDRAARIISGLMDLLKDHPDYHGSGPVDEGYQFLVERERKADALAKRQELEEAVQAKFAHLSDQALMNRMSRAPDFGYDDEEVELTRRARLMGLAWRWTGDMFRPTVELYKPEIAE